jgi:CRP-like cAMP-binding protein
MWLIISSKVARSGVGGQFVSSAQMASAFSANKLLAALSPRELGRLSAQFQPVTLAHKQILYEADGTVPHVYFPTSGIVARVIAMEDGSGIEVGLAGREGATGICAFLGDGDVSPYREAVLVPGEAFRIETTAFTQEINRGGSLSSIMRQYLFASFCMASHFAACNQLHNVQQRCCRLLLMMRDRIDADDQPVTHEGLSLLLGVRRASVSETARQLQDDNMIRYRWGRVAILDRPGMESLTCRCYHSVKAHFNGYNGAGKSRLQKVHQASK